MHLINEGATDQSIDVFIQDSSSTIGAGLTGLAYNTASLTAYYRRGNGAVTQITLATLANAQAAHADGGFVQIDATNQPGMYRLDLPDAVVAAGEDRAQIFLKGAANMAPVAVGIGLLAPTPDVNVVQLSGDATAANNAEAFFDGTGYAGTNNVIPTVSTLTGHTPQTGDSYAIVNSGTHGNAALKTLIDAVDAALAVADGNIDDIEALLALMDADLTAVKASTDNLPASPAATGDAMTLTEAERNAVADAFLNRNVAGGSSTGRTVKEALYRLRNRVAVAAGTATVYEVDDSTSAWTAAVTTAAGDPVSEVDPS